MPTIALRKARRLVLIEQPLSVTSALSKPMNTPWAGQLADAAALRRVFLTRYALKIENVVNPAQIAGI